MDQGYLPSPLESLPLAHGLIVAELDVEQSLCDRGPGLLWRSGSGRAESFAESDGSDPCLVPGAGQRGTGGNRAAPSRRWSACNARLHKVDSCEMGRPDLVVRNAHRCVARVLAETDVWRNNVSIRLYLTALC